MYSDSTNNLQNKELDSEFFAKRILVQYRRYIELQTLKEDRDKFFKILTEVENEIKAKVPNVSKNLLFICDVDISRYVFLVCFLKLPRFVTNRYINLSTLCSVWWGGGVERSSFSVEDDDSLNSTQGIKEDICCFYADPTMTSSANNGKIFASTITTRENRYNSRYEHLINWVFYRGDEVSLQTSANTADVYNYFHDNPETHQIIKLRSFKSFIGTKGGDLNINNLSDLY